MYNSIGQYFQNAYGGENGRKNYIRAHYDISHYGSSSIRTSMDDRNSDTAHSNVAGRIRNALVMAINEQVILPKAILMIIDADILEDINHYKPGISDCSGRILEWIFNQFHKIITSHKERLPSKSRKFKYPTIFWYLLPSNSGFGKYEEFRQKFNKCLQDVVNLFREMQTIQIKGWDSQDETLVSSSTSGTRFTAAGLNAYWQGICDYFESWDREQMKISTSNPAKRNFLEKCSNNKKYRLDKTDVKFKLPKPK